MLRVVSEQASQPVTLANASPVAWTSADSENVQVVAGDRILLPKAWESESKDFTTAVRQAGATVAYIDRIGLI